jgi:HD-GYP domain-containing protein (c-di-GMP phosphodiesterase class II)
LGALTVSFAEVRPRDEEILDTLAPVAGALAGYLSAARSRREVRDSYGYLAHRFQEITGIYHNETAPHLERIGAYCARVARDLGRSPREAEDIGLFARLHDLGKIKVPREILSKPGPLGAEEFSLMKRHAVWGAEILGDAEWLAMARSICRTHHEKWDGSGYPEGLVGEAIPWEGRIAALADIYDALRGRRVYKPSLSHEEAARIILDGDGRTLPRHFAPEVLDWFSRRHSAMDEIFETYRED